MSDNIKYYGNTTAKCLNHETSESVYLITEAGRNILSRNPGHDFIELKRELRDLIPELDILNHESLKIIGIDNALELALVPLRAENALLDMYQDHTVVEFEPSKSNISSDTEEQNPEVPKDLVVTIAELCWAKRISIRDLAAHLNVGEDVIRTIRSSDEYVGEIERLMLSYRSPAETLEWIESYPRSTMPSRFGKFVGLSAIVAEDLITRVETILLARVE